MASAKCGHCSSTRFDSSIESISGLKYKVIFIKCASCGVVVGTEPYWNTAAMLEKIGKALRIDIYR